MFSANIATELHCQRGQQDGLAYGDGANHLRVAHVTNVRDQPERDCAIGARHHQWRPVQDVHCALDRPRHRDRRGHINKGNLIAFQLLLSYWKMVSRSNATMFLHWRTIDGIPIPTRVQLQPFLGIGDACSSSRQSPGGSSHLEPHPPSPR